MNKLKFYFLYAFIAGFMYLLPYNAFSAGEIEFHATNNTAQERCLQCEGPFSRKTPRVIVSPGGGMTYFYSAAITEFSPYGPWFCSLYQVDSCFLLGSEPELTTGIVVQPGMPVADLIISEQDGFPIIIQKFPGLEAESGAGLSVASKLGNDPAPGARDVDTFRVSAEEGDELTIRLEGDPSAGYIGTYARLRLISDRRIGHIEEVEAGELPLEINVTIPETGTYELTVAKVAQSDVPDNLLSFKGGYILSVDSADDKVEALIPAENVEH